MPTAQELSDKLQEYRERLLAVMTAARVFHSVPALPEFGSDGKALEQSLRQMIAQLNARTDVLPALQDYLAELNELRSRIMADQRHDDQTWARSRYDVVLVELVNLTMALDHLSGVFPR